MLVGSRLLANSVLQKFFLSIYSLTECSIHLSRLCRNLSISILGKIDIVHAFVINGLINNTEFSVNILFLGSEEGVYQFASSICWKFRSVKPLGRFFYSDISASKIKDIDIIVSKKKEK